MYALGPEESRCTCGFTIIDWTLGCFRYVILTNNFHCILSKLLIDAFQCITLQFQIIFDLPFAWTWSKLILYSSKFLAKFAWNTLILTFKQWRKYEYQKEKYHYGAEKPSYTTDDRTSLYVQYLNKSAIVWMMLQRRVGTKKAERCRSKTRFFFITVVFYSSKAGYYEFNWVAPLSLLRNAEYIPQSCRSK